MLKCTKCSCLSVSFNFSIPDVESRMVMDIAVVCMSGMYLELQLHKT